MTSPWKYSGQSVPQGKPPGGTASTEHPACPSSSKQHVNDLHAQGKRWGICKLHWLSLPARTTATSRHADTCPPHRMIREFKYESDKSVTAVTVKTTLNSDDNEHVEPKTAHLRMFQTWTKAFHWVSASPGAACLAPTCLLLSPLRLPAISHGHGRSVCGLSVSPSGAPGHFTRPGAATFSPTFSLTMLHEAPAKSRSVVGRNGCNDRCEHTGRQTP